MPLDKYAYVDDPEVTKTASATSDKDAPPRCPTCSSRLESVTPPRCPNCGSEPFEPERR